MTDRTFAQLLSVPGVDEHCELRGPLGIMAYHGGALEEATDLIADAVARRVGASYYAVVQPADVLWHIPSHDVRAEHSPVLASFFEHVRTVVTIHGYGRSGWWTSVLLGGRNRPLALHIARHLMLAVPEYTMVTNLEAMPRELRGQHPHNPVNVPPDHGVQIELPPRIRGRGTTWAGWPADQLTPHTSALIDGLVAALSSWERTHVGADTCR